MFFWGVDAVLGVAFWFVLCSVLWVLKLLQLCEVVWSLEREGSRPGWWQTKGKGCFKNMGNKPTLNPEIAVIFLSFLACGAELNSAQMPLDCICDLCNKW